MPLTIAIRLNGQAPGLKLSIAPAGTIAATLDSIAGVNRVDWEVIGTDETSDAAALTASLAQSGIKGETVTFDAEGAGTSGVLKAWANGDPLIYATVKWYVPAANGLEVGAANEETESHATFGTTGIMNAAIRLAGGATVQEDTEETRCLLWAPSTNSGDWTLDDVANQIWGNAVLGAGIAIPLALPHGVRLSSVSVWYQPNGGHGVLPDNMPYAALLSYDTASGGQSIADASDTSSDVSAYELAHAVTVTVGGGHIVDRETKRYTLTLTSESGGDAIVGAAVYAVFATWTRLAGSALGHD